ncbi:hypothetical protein AB1Y20_001955 [Prymnesium parvum]|uniref:Uncharacterized protein n=1 Tax=Prymnesium parvum TaxID=97485 RepID=A0AB34J7Q0_PRYPA
MTLPGCLEANATRLSALNRRPSRHQLQVLSRFLVLEKEKTESKGNGKSVLKEAVRKNEITKTDATLLNRFVSNFNAIKTLELFNVFEQAVKAEKFHQFEMMDKVENIERKIKFVTQVFTDKMMEQYKEKVKKVRERTEKALSSKSTITPNKKKRLK